jgi:hypothetical protein
MTSATAKFQLTPAPTLSGLNKLKHFLALSLLGFYQKTQPFCLILLRSNQCAYNFYFIHIFINRILRNYIYISHFLALSLLITLSFNVFSADNLPQLNKE